jgi:hypothetical protein
VTLSGQRWLMPSKNSIFGDNQFITYLRAFCSK